MEFDSTLPVQKFLLVPNNIFDLNLKLTNEEVLVNCFTENIYVDYDHA